MTILEVQTSLQKALTEANDAQAKLDRARAGLEPLETAAAEKQKEVNSLILEFQKLSGVVPVKRSRRGGVSGPRKSYNIDPKKKIEAAGKRAITKALSKNPSLTESEKKKIGRDAEKSLAAKLGV
jgi:hypothetical protein